MRTRVTELFDIEVPIVQAPMAARAVPLWRSRLRTREVWGHCRPRCCRRVASRDDIIAFRSRSTGPLNLNFFCHTRLEPTDSQMTQWQRVLAPYYAELGITAPAAANASGRAPFDDESCALVEELRPEIVSFHFGLPEAGLVERVFATGAKVISSATTVDEAVWLQDHGCDAVIAQGVEAGGHRGMFLTDDISAQVGTMALVPLVKDAVEIPVIAAGGIGDARGAAAAFLLGAGAIQLGTTYLLCPESTISALHRTALRESDTPTALTNVFTGRPARGLVNRIVAEVGPMSRTRRRSRSAPASSVRCAPPRRRMDQLISRRCGPDKRAGWQESTGP